MGLAVIGLGMLPKAECIESYLIGTAKAFFGATRFLFFRGSSAVFLSSFL
jgi:hypothetical protein